EKTVSSVLVIDDESMILSMVKQALAKVNFSVDTAEAGSDGIKKFNDGHYDLVITDVCMPGIDGHLIVKHIKTSDKRTTPVIGISGTPWLLKNSGFDQVLPKPFAIKTLIDTAKGLTAGSAMKT
ncbi:MAG: response regulator, partial [Desulfatitalea sp.]